MKVWVPTGGSAVAGGERRRRGFVMFAVVLGLVAIAVVSAVFGPFFSGKPPRDLGTRSIEARLTGDLPWAPFVHRSVALAPDLRLAKTLETLSRNGADVFIANRQHATGLADLAAGQSRQAVASLTAAAESTNDGQVWNDLAVAMVETASRYEAPELLADALAACDRALAADPRLIEPSFNRALVLERLGLRDDARQAWQFYLTRDASSAWAAEAREHLRLLHPQPSYLELVDAASVRGADIREHVRRNPQQARLRTEMQILGRWGKAILVGDRARAERYLRLARDTGDELVRRNGDEAVASAVAAIARADPAARISLAAGHAQYEEGLTLHQAARPGDAEPRLRNAVASFEAGRSPMALRARFFLANTAFEQGRREEGQREVERLIAMTPVRSRGAHAELLWQLGVCHGTKADWGEAIRNLDRAAALFDEIGEARNGAAVRRVLAVVFDQIGDPARAWSHRVAALRGLGYQSDLALIKAVASIAAAASLRGKWDTAVSFLTLEIEIARRAPDPVQLVDALISRAAVHSRLGDVAHAREDLVRAERASANVKDASYAAYGRAVQTAVRARLAGSSSEAVSLLTEAVQLHSTRGDRMNLPGLLLQRARALRAGGDSIAAAADLDAGMAELERHRSSLPQGDLRWGAFFSAEELFEEAIDLALEQSDPAQGFAVAERGRARVLLESYGRSPAAIDAPPADTVIVEYAALPSKLVAFVATASGMTAVATKCDRKTLAAEVDAFTAALRSSDAPAARRTGAVLYRRLVAPVAAYLANASTVAFVPDPWTTTVPFNALVDDQGRYFIERHAIVVTPSAAVFAAAMNKRGAARPPRSLVVISSESGEGGGRLASVDAEARAIARAYRNATRIENDGATLDAVARALSSADVVHFAGHAVGDDSGLLPASLLLRRGGRDHHVTVREIAELRADTAATVVLAGCSTARGEKRGLEGAISVAHGFLIAGAPSVIATLWPIDDRAAAAFFPRLHRHLADGVPPAEALRRVQLDAIRDGNATLSLWAALIDIGT